MKKITLENYRTDPHYSRIVRAVSDIIGFNDVVAPVEVFIRMELLRREALEDWRFGRIPYLERVILCNLAKASRILRILGIHAHNLGLKPSPTVYMRFGKGPKSRLRFSKTGDPGLEMAYALHFVRNASKQKKVSAPALSECSDIPQEHCESPEAIIRALLPPNP